MMTVAPEGATDKTVKWSVGGTNASAVSVAEPTYNVTFKAGTADVGNWTATPTTAKKGETVTVKYTGTKKVKSVKAVKK